ncbi:ABC transporter permease [Vagococcus carniphilus]|uniref:ABC transporter permease n=1 Tax=Vagococcus carniphilus TaxID=218144 RepID=A0AAW8U3I8_9ENTE|nr:ABC transporter permease [Vagococcus carniphilus]MDT2815028.1 ABC transporter permease [Vagococcus carniphilus]MDT2829697.1 ABC transporter permease [Vagococcus carniphilus]MDT2834170.1 ABC transporter permease [Vagococcus carniphilus]MDT2839156.1 ABC transporter permease [Vagococcus carniphilus]MDT2853214.1 ABC transporter permease [Vagococcus carniphilus]
MNFFKRAMASVTRRKGKSLILFAVIFILGNVMAGAIAIDQGTKSVEDTIKAKLGAVATISEDYEKMNQDQEQSGDDNFDVFKDNSPTTKTLKEIGELPEVKYYDYSLSSGATTEKLKMIEMKDENFQYGPGMNWINIKGVNYNEVFDIKNNIISLTDGRVFEKDEVNKGKSVALISDEFAKENNLRVGDKMTIDTVIEDQSDMMNPDNSDSDESKDTKKVKKDFQVKVIGTFKVLQADKGSKQKSKDDQMMDQMTYTERANVIYAPNKFVQEFNKTIQLKTFEEFPANFGENMTKEKLLKSIETDFSSAKYILKKPEMAEDFKVKATQILEQEKLKYSRVILSTDQYEQVAGPVKGMAKISKLVLIISILASILIITLVTILFLRDRKHELGIYLALGEKRTRVVGQIVLEVVTVAIIAITISVFTGNMLAKGFSNSLIQTQKVEQTNNNSADFQLDYELSQLTNNNVSEEDVIEAYQISLNTKYVLLFYVVGLGVILVSTVAPLVYIMRLNPKKIMM